jgi:hypothetical protein
MTNKIHFLNLAFVISLALASPFATFAMEPGEEHQLEHTSRSFNLHTYMALGLGLTDQHMNAIYHSTPKLLHEQHVYERFLRGKLVYKPDPNSDEGMVIVPFTDLDEEIDLSQCGDAGQFLSINTGYRKDRKPENADKVEVWITPYYFVERNLEGSASRFKGTMMRSWIPFESPVGMFFTFGNCETLDLYEFVRRDWEFYNKAENNLNHIWRRAPATHYITHNQYALKYATRMARFHLVFDEPKRVPEIQR